MIILWPISKSNASKEVTLNEVKSLFYLVTNIKIKYSFNDITPWSNKRKQNEIKKSTLHYICFICYIKVSMVFQFTAFDTLKNINHFRFIS